MVTRRLIVEITDKQLRIDTEGDFLVYEIMEIAEALKRFAVSQKVVTVGRSGGGTSDGSNQ